MAAGGIEGGASTNGLSVYDIAQAEKMFNSDGEKIFDSVNEADGVDFFGNPIEKDDDDDNGPSHAEIIANANASQNSASQSTSTYQDTQQQAASSAGISEDTSEQLSGSGYIAGSDVGTGVGGSDISGPMRKGGLASKKKK